MDHADYDRPRTQPVMRRLGAFLVMGVNVYVLVAVVLVTVNMHLACLKQLSKRVQTKQDQHSSNTSLQLRLQRFRYLKFKKNDQKADDKKRDRMAYSPQSA